MERDIGRKLSLLVVSFYQFRLFKANLNLSAILGVLVVFGAVPIVYQIKLYAKRYRTRKMFEQDFANQIKMTGKPGEELMKPAISCNIIDMEDSSVEVEYFIQLRILLFVDFN